MDSNLFYSNTSIFSLRFIRKGGTLLTFCDEELIQILVRHGFYAKNRSKWVQKLIFCGGLNEVRSCLTNICLILPTNSDMSIFPQSNQFILKIQSSYYAQNPIFCLKFSKKTGKKKIFMIVVSCFGKIRFLFTHFTLVKNIL